MAEKFDKFLWIKAVAGDKRLKVGERFVLTNTAVRYVRWGEDVFRVRQTTIAEQFAIGVRTVRESISRARQLGYLVLAEERMRGRSYHGPDVHRLLIPADAAAINDGIPAQIDRNSGTDRPEYRQNTTLIAAARNAPTSENADPKVFRKVLEKGEGEGCGFAAPPTPPSFSEENNKPPICHKHPNGDEGEPCRRCQHVREWHDAREAEVARQAADAARIEGIRGCRACDEEGFIHERGLDQETKTPHVFLPPPNEDHAQAPEYLRRSLVAFSDPARGVSWPQAICQHGTGTEYDTAHTALHTLGKIFNAGYRACGLDAFLAADGDIDAARELEKAARDEWIRKRDEAFRAEQAEARAAKAAKTTDVSRLGQQVSAPYTTPKPHDMTSDKYDSLRDYGDPEENEYLYTTPKPYCDDHPRGTEKPCRACGEARKNHQIELAERKEWRVQVFRDRAAIKFCSLCDDRGRWYVDGDEPVRMFHGNSYLTVTCRHKAQKNEDYVQERLNEGWYFPPPEAVAGLIEAADARINKALNSIATKLTSPSTIR